MLTALIFILVIGVLVLVHEWGHFVMAKRAGMKVEEFGFGFPPRIISWRKGETTYSINWILFGGFVKILGEDGDTMETRSFGTKSIGTRFGVIAAGVVMNVFLAAILLMVVNFFGLRIGLVNDTLANQAQDKQVQIIEVAPDSPAQKAGLQPLDELVAIKIKSGQINVISAQQTQNIIKENVGSPITLVIRHGGEQIEKEIVPRTNPPEGEGALGISLALTGVVSYPWYESIWRGIYDALILVVNTITGYYLLFKTLFIKGKLIAEVSGPIGIASLTGQAARVGINYLLQFVALISINLAILNFLPFPALDGGRALLLGIEKLKGTPVNRKVEGMLNMIGFYLLVALMLYITIKDISRFL